MRLRTRGLPLRLMVLCILLLAPLSTLHQVPSVAHAAAADVLILSTTVTNGLSSPEAQAATALGLSVEIADPTSWAAKTTSDFASYKAIILGDPNCSSGTTAIDPATANNAVWGPAITGNVAINGTDPTHHSLGRSGAAKLITSSIAFAIGQPG